MAISDYPSCGHIQEEICLTIREHWERENDDAGPDGLCGSLPADDILWF